MRARSICALGFVLVASSADGGCVGDDPVGGQASSSGGPDGSVSGDGGGPGPGPGTDDSGTPQQDAGVDTGPPACTKIQVTTIAGAAATGIANGAGNIATFNAPEGITVNPTNGELFVADTGNDVIRKVLPDGTTSTFSTAVNTGGGPNQPWYAPIHIVYTFSLYAVDQTHDQVFSVGAGSAATSVFALGSMRAFTTQPTTFQLFVVGTHRVAKWTGAGFEATRFSGADFTGGFVDGAGDVARYEENTDLAFDGDADLYVTDRGNHRLRKVTATEGASYGTVVTVAGSATPGHVDGTGGAAQFEGPDALVIDPTTHLIYVADGPTIRVVKTTGEVTTLVGSNAAFADGDGCSAKFVNIKGITKFANELYVVDVNRVRKIVMN